MNTVKQIFVSAKFKETTLLSEPLFSTGYDIPSVLSLVTNAGVQQIQQKGNQVCFGDTRDREFTK